MEAISTQENESLGRVLLTVRLEITDVRGDILEMLFELYYTFEGMLERGPDNVKFDGNTHAAGYPGASSEDELFSRPVVAYIKIDLSNFQDIYEVSLQNQIGIGIDACREYVDEMISPEKAQMLLDICEKYDPQKAKFVSEYIEDNEKGEKMRQLSIKRRDAGFGRRECRKDPKATNAQKPTRTNGQDPEGTEGTTMSFKQLLAEREARQAARQARQAVRLAQEKAYALENLAPWEHPPVEAAP